MKLGFMTIAKVYRKKDVQEITDRATGRVTGESKKIKYTSLPEHMMTDSSARTQRRSQESQPFFIQSMSHGAKILSMNLQSRHTTALQCRLKMSSRKTPLLQLLRLLSN